MPRPHIPTTLRARNRVTNKTRLKIHRGDIDFDPDDAPISLSNDTAGVDADDANVSLKFPSILKPLRAVSSSLLHPCLMAPSDWLPPWEHKSMDC